MLPRWLSRTVAYCGAVLLLGVVVWFVAQLLLRIALVTWSLATALLLAALLAPITTRLIRWGLPRALAALLSIVTLLGIPVGIGLLLYTQVRGQIDDLAAAVTCGIDDLRRWLIDGPLGLDATQVTRLRDGLVSYVEQTAPSPAGGATTALRLLGAVLLTVFAIFFLLKDGPQMWRWLVQWFPTTHRERLDGAGAQAWSALTSYVLGTVLIAFADAISIGVALLLLGVPLWLSLTLLTFVGAFVPLLGATIAGAAAVLVTLVTEGGRDALVVLAVVLIVQQVEGNLLQPLVIGRAVNLHPLAILTAVTCGTLVLGIFGAVLAVPLTAVVYQVAVYLRKTPDTAEPAGLKPAR